MAARKNTRPSVRKPATLADGASRPERDEEPLDAMSAGAAGAARRSRTTVSRSRKGGAAADGASNARTGSEHEDHEGAQDEAPPRAKSGTKVRAGATRDPAPAQVFTSAPANAAPVKSPTLAALGNDDEEGSLFIGGPLSRYVAPGPVAASFLKSDAFVAAIRGPIGSGKSTACAMKLLRNVMRQQRLADGWIRRRSAVIRNTYPELKTTTIKTWQQWFPPSIGRWRETNPPSHHIVDTTAMVDWEVIFIALDRPEDVRKLLSMELSDAWINEAREVPRAILDGLTGRVGRYPRREEGGCTDPQIILDTNPPDTDHWWYRMAEEANGAANVEGDMGEEAEANAQLEAELRRIGALRPTQHLSQWFAQPGGMSEHAENLANLPPGYYLKAKANKGGEWVKVYVNGDYGYVLDGTPVYPDYRDNVHCREFEINPRLPIDIGLDFGLTPAAVFAQQMPGGQWRKHSELVTENMGIVRFAELLRAHIQRYYPGMQIRTITGDPAGDIRNDDERTTYDLLRAAGIEARPAPSNETTLRIEAVSGAMRRLIDGEPGLLVHPRCRMLRKAYAGAYHYKRVALSGEARFRDVPDKNAHSHVADADQYLMLGAGEGRALVRRMPSGPRDAYAISDYSVFGD